MLKKVTKLALHSNNINANVTERLNNTFKYNIKHTK